MYSMCSAVIGATLVKEDLINKYKLQILYGILHPFCYGPYYCSFYYSFSSWIAKTKTESSASESSATKMVARPSPQFEFFVVVTIHRNISFYNNNTPLLVSKCLMMTPWAINLRVKARDQVIVFQAQDQDQVQAKPVSRLFLHQAPLTSVCERSLKYSFWNDAKFFAISC